jgi:hypothetical protein
MVSVLDRATALADRLKREAKGCAPHLEGEGLANLALYFACLDLARTEPGGFDRSATLARAADAKRAEGPPSL